MGYFSNGTEGTSYELHYCENCLHMVGRKGCPILGAHLEFNYKDCNNKDSMLHWFIPRDERGGNAECKWFEQRDTTSGQERLF